MYDISLLRSNRSFRVFWGVEAVETMASGLNSVALPWFILTFTGSPLQLGLAFALRSAPDVVVSPLIGGLIDRHSRTRLMALAHASTAGLTLVLPALYLTDQLQVLHVYLVMLCLSVTRSLSHNASRATLPDLVEQPRLDEANGLLMGTRSGGRLAFLLVGGGLTVLLGPATTLAGAALGSALAASLLLVSSVDTGRIPSDGGLRTYLADFRAGVGTIRGTTVLVQLLAFGIAYNLFVVPYGSVLLPALARTAFAGAGALTVLLACWQGGSLVGNALAGRTTASPRTKLVAGVGVVGACTALMGAVVVFDVASALPFGAGWRTELVLVAAPLFVAGVGQPLFNVPSSSLLQSKAPEGNRGTVVTVQNSVLQASFPIPLLVTGELLRTVSPSVLFGAAGVGLLALAVLIGLLFET